MTFPIKDIVMWITSAFHWKMTAELVVLVAFLMFEGAESAVVVVMVVRKSSSVAAHSLCVDLLTSHLAVYVLLLYFWRCPVYLAKWVWCGVLDVVHTDT